MTPVRCDALVLFGISGDLAFRKILPAVYSLFARQQLDLPVIGVARGEFDLPRLIARLRESLQQAHLKVDPAACARLEARLAFVQGEFRSAGAEPFFRVAEMEGAGGAVEAQDQGLGVEGTEHDGHPGHV